MRRIVLTLAALALFVGVPNLSATEVANETPAAEIAPQMSTADVPAAGELQLNKIQLEQRMNSDEAAAAQFERGSFWWIVAAVVVGGVIIAVLL